MEHPWHPRLQQNIVIVLGQSGSSISHQSLRRNSRWSRPCHCCIGGTRNMLPQRPHISGWVSCFNRQECTHTFERRLHPVPSRLLVVQRLISEGVWRQGRRDVCQGLAEWLAHCGSDTTQTTLKQITFDMLSFRVINSTGTRICSPLQVVDATCTSVLTVQRRFSMSRSSCV